MLLLSLLSLPLEYRVPLLLLQLLLLLLLHLLVLLRELLLLQLLLRELLLSEVLLGELLLGQLLLGVLLLGQLLLLQLLLLLLWRELLVGALGVVKVEPVQSLQLLLELASRRSLAGTAARRFLVGGEVRRWGGPAGGARLGGARLGVVEKSPNITVGPGASRGTRGADRRRADWRARHTLDLEEGAGQRRPENRLCSWIVWIPSLAPGRGDW